MKRFYYSVFLLISERQSNSLIDLYRFRGNSKLELSFLRYFNIEKVNLEIIYYF